MKKKDLPRILTRFDWRFMYTGALASSLVIFIPFFDSAIKSYGVLLFLILMMIIYYIFQDVFAEYQSTFLKSSGSVYDYLKQSYSKGFAFIIGTILFLLALFLVQFYFFKVLIDIIGSIIYSFIFIIALTIILLIISLFFRRIIFFISHALGIFALIFILIVISFNISSFELTLPFPILDINHPIMLFISLFSLYFFINTPLSFFCSETEEFEEEAQDISRYHKLQAGILIPIIVFLFSGMIPFNGLYIYQYAFEGEIIQIGAILYAVCISYLFILWLLTIPRLLNQLTKDGLLPSSLIKKDYRIIVTSIFFSSFISIFIFFGLTKEGFKAFIETSIIQSIIYLFSLATFLLFLGVYIMRKKKPDLERPVSIKHSKIPLIGSIVGFLAFLYSLIIYPIPVVLLIFLIILSVLLFIIFILFELYYNEEMTGKIRGITAYLSIFTHKLILPEQIKERLIDLLGECKEKTILEYGSGIGTMTMKIAQCMGSKGKLYSTDISQNAILFLKKRLDKKNFQVFKIKVIKSKPSSLNPAIPKVDKIISVGAISHVKEIDHLLKEMNLLLPNGGKIVVMDYDKLAGFFPNKWLSSDDAIKKYFDRAGFGVSIERKRTILWEYVFISGIKFKNAYYLDTWYTKE